MRNIGATRHDVLGMTLDYIASDNLIGAVIANARQGVAGYCCVGNVHQCILVHDDQEFRRRVNAATFVVPDSVILQRTRCILHRQKYLPPLRGYELMLALCDAAARNGVPVALVGGRSEEALSRLQDRLLHLYPDLQIAFATSPPFRPATETENAQIDERLIASGARLVFVGLGCPKQENWMAAHASAGSAMMIGVGAAFDFLAGVISPSPIWVHRIGLEWLYRLVREPSRLGRRYLTTSPRFILLALKQAVVGPRRPANPA